jgi:hypothetical protein
MEKIHGTSAHISYKDGRVGFFAGGASYEEFIKLFDANNLKVTLDLMVGVGKSVHIYGEAYGGNMQKMRDTYGNELKFVAFEVKIGDVWLNVPKAEEFVKQLGLDFVAYEKIETTMAEIDRVLYTRSEQAIKNGIGIRKVGDIIFVEQEKMREGIVLRPLEEVVKNNGKRVIAKHKRPEFAETKTLRKMDADKLKVLSEANAIANEWVTPMRLSHVLDNFTNPSIENLGEIIKAMIEDVLKAIAQNPTLTIKQVREKLELTSVKSDEVDEIIDNIVKQAEPLLKEKGERAFSPLMGEVMKVLRGKVDGKVAREIESPCSGWRRPVCYPFRFFNGRMLLARLKRTSLLI